MTCQPCADAAASGNAADTMHSRQGRSGWHQYGNSLISLLLRDHFAAAAVAAVVAAAAAADAQTIE